jgi:hypothetical protein
MFDLFKKPKGVKVIDKVWLSKQAKWNACLQMVKVDATVLLVTWFDETFRECEDAGLDRNTVRAQNLSYDKTVGRMVVFAEHYPLASVEHDLFMKLQLKEVPVLSALDEPIFQHFAGEQIIDIMKKLGAGEDEIIAHSMVTKSIRRAQESLAETSGTDYPATSSNEWFTLNLNVKK